MCNQLYTYSQYQHHLTQLEVQYQELDHYGVAARKHKIPGRAIYTLVVRITTL